jgi:hypothetical protein
MTGAPKPKAYMVCATFGVPPNAAIYTNACLAQSSEVAVAMCVAFFVQESGTKEPINGINCMELSEAYLSDSLAAIRGSGKTVVSLREVEKESVVHRCTCGAGETSPTHSDVCAWLNRLRPWGSPPEPAPSNALTGAHPFRVSISPELRDAGMCAVCGAAALDPVHSGPGAA